MSRQHCCKETIHWALQYSPDSGYILASPFYAIRDRICMPTEIRHHDRPSGFSLSWKFCMTTSSIPNDIVAHILAMCLLRPCIQVLMRWTYCHTSLETWRLSASVFHRTRPFFTGQWFSSLNEGYFANGKEPRLAACFLLFYLDCLPVPRQISPQFRQRCTSRWGQSRCSCLLYYQLS